MGLVWLTVLALTVAAPAGSAKRTVAVLTAIKGKVELKRAGEREFKRLTSTTMLTSGDEVRLAPGATAALLREDSAPALLRGGRTVSIAATGARPAASGATVKLQRISDVLTSTERTAPMTVRNDAEAEPPLLLLAPRYSKELTGLPEFRWKQIEGARSYTLKLLDANEDPVMPPMKTTETSAKLPEARRLKPGTYIAEVTTDDRSGRRLFDTARFTVAGADEAQSIRQSLDAARKLALPACAPNVPLCVALIESGQFAEAETLLVAATKDLPEDKTLHLLLADLYRRTKLEHRQLRALKAAGVEPVAK